ncbi:hypothetical protein LEP1GSC016_4237 [Leptospira borgpetersenii serovar Hardjo-bovis str. Sponselee]|uniref:Uncharacterized protein n=2 Tax=Leptospira borgpetersenii TaxID=174 RepID=M6BWP8_LEPBO|nr:hypothetical protein LEP1GSC016_4237 [Leptospira borgpetersenii serovar Hardjo-bovis str. Sponselee]EMO63464.1 hypothetical protein LEP1GSC133_4689 [Leptospira borgpetersenii serovar Pomona str. 200901868]
MDEKQPLKYASKRARIPVCKIIFKKHNVFTKADIRPGFLI